jgi:hypothetical protein
MGSNLWFDFCASPSDSISFFQRPFDGLTKEIAIRLGRGKPEPASPFLESSAVSGDHYEDSGQLRSSAIIQKPHVGSSSVVVWSREFFESAGVRLDTNKFGYDSIDAVCLSELLHIFPQESKDIAVSTSCQHDHMVAFIKFLVEFVVVDTVSALRLSALIRSQLGQTPVDNAHLNN